MSAFFVTGTDTDAGKTLVTLALMQVLQDQGLSVNGFKPVAAGIDENGLNPDALLLQAKSSNELAYQQVNPYLFEPAIAPHIAAAHVEQEINLAKINKAFIEVKSSADVVLVEGAGGWLVPINNRQDVADIALENDLPVILVVGLKLGCINHARLTTESIQAKGGRLVGWVGSLIDRQMINIEENIQTLKQYIMADCLGVIPFLEKADDKKAASYIDVDKLRQLPGLD